MRVYIGGGKGKVRSSEGGFGWESGLNLNGEVGGVL